MLADADLSLHHRRLLYRAAQLRQEIVSAGGRGADRTTDEVRDEKDIAEAEAEDVVADAEVQRDLDELRDITAALARIADGTYGDCMGCGAAIDPRRLVAQPTASRCLACQTEFDAGAGGHARRRA